jgi:hypothetical protein
VQVFGYTTGFFTLAAIAVGGLAFFVSFMPETKPQEEIGSTSAQGDTPIPEACLRADYFNSGRHGSATRFSNPGDDPSAIFRH